MAGGPTRKPTDTTPKGVVISPYWDEEWIRKVEEMEATLNFIPCGAKTNAGRPCNSRAGAGTEHYGEGRCKFHGGKTPIQHGRRSTLRHQKLGTKIQEFLSNPDLLDIRTAIVTTWAAIDTMLEEDTLITPDRAQEIVATMSRVGTMIKQHHDITEGQKIMIEVPQFMEWAEFLYELAIKHILAVGGDTRAFLSEAQQYYTGAVSIVTGNGNSAPALGPGDSVEIEELLRPGESLS